MSNHTPGDWEMVVAPAFGPEDYEGITIESPSTGTIICDMAGGLPLIEILKNARLIEKAPKMKELCEDLLHQISTDSDLETITGRDKYKMFESRLRCLIDEVDKVESI
jgi:hypothetical protein